MTAAAAQAPSDSPANSGGSPPVGWEELRADDSIQFAPVIIPETPPPKPSWLSQQLDAFFRWLAEVLAPLGEAMADSWWWLRWVPVVLVGLFALVLLIRLIDPSLFRFGRKARAEGAPAPEETWRPDAAASLAPLWLDGVVRAGWCHLLDDSRFQPAQRHIQSLIFFPGQ